MPEIKFSMTDDDHAMVKRAAKLAALTVASWVRSIAIEEARRRTPKADDRPTLGKVAERELPGYLETMKNLAGLNRTVAEHLAKHRAMPDKTAPQLAWLSRFEAWARAQGHLQGE